jgi:predicted O-methyltransferase YrrM
LASSIEIETFQNPWELEELVRIFDYHGPARVLEIGCWDGGTLQHWLQNSDTVVVIDNLMRRENDWYAWARYAETDLYTIKGFSQSEDCIRDAARHAPYDFLFIDGDHTYDSVRRDWDNYSPMVREGGIIALHDILPRAGYGVSQLWEQITSLEGVRYMTICQNQVMPGNEGRCGIGVVFV